jgi:iron complex outermembrane receptor protein
MFRIFLLSILLGVSLSAPAYSQSDTVRRVRADEVIVTGFPAEEGITPVPLDEIKLRQIEEHATIAQPAKVASFTPSGNFYSQSGTDIGYSFLSIRGFEQRRLSILVNGIPQNDPEDHNVYWINMPELLGSAGRIQVQRGAGSAFYGPPAIGGSINLETKFPSVQGLTLTSGFGSYNTFKHSIEAASGLVWDNWFFHGRLSRTTTDGYRNHNFAKLNGYHVSARRVSDAHILQLNVFGGMINDGLDYYGLYPAYGDNLTDTELRKKNVSESFAYERRPEEQERFAQPHFEVLSTYNINDLLTLNNTVFYVQGDGEFDFDGTWVSPFYGYTHPQYYRLTSPYAEAYGFTPIHDSIVTLGNELTRAFVGNKQYGWLPRFDWQFAGGKMFFGAELRMHNSVHWGELLHADMLPQDLPEDYKFYQYNGAKQIFSPYVAGNFDLDEGLRLSASLQLVAQKYSFSDEKPFFVDPIIAQAKGLDTGWYSYDFEVPFFFVNPRLGLSFDIATDLTGFISGALTSREPRLKDYYNAEFFSEPNVKRLPSGNFDFNSPNIKPETLIDLEVGLQSRPIEIGEGNTLRAGVNGYYMDFTDELAKIGKVDRFGSPVVANAEKSTYIGGELSFDLMLMKDLTIDLNAAFSKNQHAEIKIKDSVHTNKVPIGFPAAVLSGIVSYRPLEELRISVFGRYVGETYGDLENSETYKNPAYFVADAMLAITFPLGPIKKFEIKLQANNVFDQFYTSYASAGTGYFVAAPRHFFGSISLGI